ncbi:hypothetical protein BC940DRAFT_350052 [Gongronella butleri]|nr:hypothetical protein BC940DRAFT_350052 [Gongronella butleri]
MSTSSVAPSTMTLRRRSSVQTGRAGAACLSRKRRRQQPPTIVDKPQQTRSTRRTKRALSPPPDKSQANEVDDAAVAAEKAEEAAKDDEEAVESESDDDAGNCQGSLLDSPLFAPCSSSQSTDSPSSMLTTPSSVREMPAWLFDEHGMQKQPDPSLYSPTQLSIDHYFPHYYTPDVPVTIDDLLPPCSTPDEPSSQTTMVDDMGDADHEDAHEDDPSSQDTIVAPATPLPVLVSKPQPMKDDLTNAPIVRPVKSVRSDVTNDGENEKTIALPESKVVGEEEEALDVPVCVALVKTDEGKEFRLLRRLDMDFVNATPLLLAGGITGHSERNMILSLEVHQFRIKRKASTLRGTWIPLYRARALALTCSIATTLEHFLRRAIEQCFPSPLPWRIRYRLPPDQNRHQTSAAPQQMLTLLGINASEASQWVRATTAPLCTNLAAIKGTPVAQWSQQYHTLPLKHTRHEDTTSTLLFHGFKPDGRTSKIIENAQNTFFTSQDNSDDDTDTDPEFESIRSRRRVKIG